MYIGVSAIYSDIANIIWIFHSLANHGWILILGVFSFNHSRLILVQDRIYSLCSRISRYCAHYIIAWGINSDWDHLIWTLPAFFTKISYFCLSHILISNISKPISSVNEPYNWSSVGYFIVGNSLILLLFLVLHQSLFCYDFTFLSTVCMWLPVKFQ